MSLQENYKSIISTAYTALFPLNKIHLLFGVLYLTILWSNFIVLCLNCFEQYVLWNVTQIIGLRGITCSSMFNKTFSSMFNKINKNLHESKQNRQFFRSRKSSTEFHFPVASSWMTLFERSNLPEKENFWKQDV